MAAMINGFDVAAAPTVTAGAYSAGDIMGGLMEFEVGETEGQVIRLDWVLIALKSAITPSLTLIIFNADPTSTTKTDNSAYSLNAADVFKVRCTLPIDTLGGFQVDHGTPNTWELGNLEKAIRLGPGSKKLYALLIDNTGVTPTGTADLQVVLGGTR